MADLKKIALLSKAIGLRNKITWSEDCWRDVDKLINAGKYEEAIGFADCYIEQQRLRHLHTSL